MALFNRETKPREPRAPRKAPEKKPVTLKMCEMVVAFVDLGWQLSPWRAEAMDETEKKALVRSLHDAAKSNVYIGNVIYFVAQGTAEGKFVGVVAGIAAIRLARREIIPPEAESGKSGEEKTGEEGQE